VLQVAAPATGVRATLTYRVAQLVPGEPAAFVRVRGIGVRGVRRFTLPARVVRDRGVFGALLTVTGATVTHGVTVPVRVR